MRFLLLFLLAGCSREPGEPIPTPPIAPLPTHEVVPAVPPSGEAPSEGAAEQPSEPPEVERPYDESADADAQIRAAVERANAGNKRVLLVFGANWCVWCRRLEWVLRNHAEVHAKLGEHFEVVHVDTGARGSATNDAIVARYGDPVQHGLPVLVVLDGSGEPVATQETGSLEEGDHHDPVRVLAFLDRVKR
jgi:thioredoxin-related protein